MALSYALGALLWSSADAATTTYTVSGLAFQPKALRFSYIGLPSLTSTADAEGHKRGMGFATSTSDRRSVTSRDITGSDPTVCLSGCRDDAIAHGVTPGPAFDGQLDLQSIETDGFVLVVDVQAGDSYTIQWEAWGGSDITAVGTVEITEPAAAGDQDYTITGFTSGATDQVVMLAGVQVAATGTAAAQDSGFCVGFGQPGINVVVVGNSDTGSATSDTDGYCQGGTTECLAMIVIGGGTSVNARASVTQWNTNGFRLNWAARATTGRRYIALGIKGGSWTVGALTIDGLTLNATAAVSGLSYTPVGLSAITRNFTENTAATAGTNDRIAVGMGSGTSNRQCWGILSETGTGAADVNQLVNYESVLAVPSTGGALLGAYDISAMASDGWTLIVDAASGAADVWIGYLTFGNAPVAPTNHFLTLMQAGA